jgi:DNA-binding IscR family transcriptional regulator
MTGFLVLQLGLQRLVHVNGSFALVRPTDQLSILDAIHAVDPLVPIARCLQGRGYRASGLCLLQDWLQQAFDLLEEGLGDVRISDVQNGSPQEQCLYEGQPEETGG